MVGVRSFPGNPYDGHVVSAQLEQTTNLLQDHGRARKQVIVDLGYRGVDADNHAKQIKALRDRADEINGDKTLSLAYQRGAIKQIERDESEVYDQFLRSVTQARHTQEEMKTVRNSSR